jgi:hypothetical protein
MTTVTSASGQSISNSIKISNLQPGTSYVIQIQAVGSDNVSDVSDWSIGYIFVVPNL